MTSQMKVKELQTWETTNNFDTVDLVKTWANCREAEIDDRGDIWIADPQDGHWMSARDIDQFLAWCDR